MPHSALYKEFCQSGRLRSGLALLADAQINHLHKLLIQTIYCQFDVKVNSQIARASASNSRTGISRCGFFLFIRLIPICIRRDANWYKAAGTDARKFLKKLGFPVYVFGYESDTRGNGPTLWKLTNGIARTSRLGDGTGYSDINSVFAR